MVGPASVRWFAAECWQDGAVPKPVVPGIRWLQWGVTVLVAAVLVVVVIRVSLCLGDDLCTFGDGALKIAVFTFGGGPFLVLLTWAIPAWSRHRATPIVVRRVGASLVGAGVVCVAIGMIVLGDGGPAAAVLPALGPGLVLGGALALGFAFELRRDRDENGS